MDMTEMTAQQVYDTVCAHLAAQARRSLVERMGLGPWGDTGSDTTCMYRSPDGLRCAIGCLIPDSEYHPEMERRGVGGIRPMVVPHNGRAPELHAPVTRSLITRHHELLARLQIAHDRSRGPDEEFIQDNLRYVVYRHNQENELDRIDPGAEAAITMWDGMPQPAKANNYWEAAHGGWCHDED